MITQNAYMNEPSPLRRREPIMNHALEQRVRDGVAEQLLARFVSDKATYARVLTALGGRTAGVRQEGLVAAAGALGTGGPPMLSAIVRGGARRAAPSGGRGARSRGVRRRRRWCERRR